MIKRKIIRCEHLNAAKQKCGNYIGKFVGETVVIKRHGREIHIGAGQPVEIKCERCGGITKVEWKGAK